jgi:hypothetical protein
MSAQGLATRFGRQPQPPEFHQLVAYPDVTINRLNAAPRSALV